MSGIECQEAVRAGPHLALGKAPVGRGLLFANLSPGSKASPASLPAPGAPWRCIHVTLIPASTIPWPSSVRVSVPSQDTSHIGLRATCPPAPTSSSLTPSAMNGPTS